jgi:hypothetical protein
MAIGQVRGVGAGRVIVSTALDPRSWSGAPSLKAELPARYIDRQAILAASGAELNVEEGRALQLQALSATQRSLALPGTGALDSPSASDDLRGAE